MPKEAEEVEAARIAYQEKGPSFSQIRPIVQEIREKRSPYRYIKLLTKAKS